MKLEVYKSQDLFVNTLKIDLNNILFAGKLKVYVYSEMLALFAGAQYDSSLSDLSNLASHLTNTCRQTDADAGPATDGGGGGGGDSSSSGLGSRGAQGFSAAAGGSEAAAGSGSGGDGAAAGGGSGGWKEEDVVKLLSELPEVRLLELPDARTLLNRQPVLQHHSRVFHHEGQEGKSSRRVCCPLRRRSRRRHGDASTRTTNASA